MCVDLSEFNMIDILVDENKDIAVFLFTTKEKI